MNDWETSLLQFFAQKGTASFRHGDFKYDRSTIRQNGRSFAHVNFPRKLVIFLGWVPPSESHSYVHTTFNGLSSTECNNSPEHRYHTLSEYTFIPVLTLEPNHEINLHYLNIVVDHALTKLVRKSVKMGQYGLNYRTTERGLTGYVQYHQLESAYTPETMQERAERLGLTDNLTRFIGRRIAA